MRRRRVTVDAATLRDRDGNVYPILDDAEAREKVANLGYDPDSPLIRDTSPEPGSKELRWNNGCPSLAGSA